MRRNLLLVGLLPLSMASCHQYPPRQCEVGQDVQVQVRSPIDDSSNRSLALTAGHQIEGSFNPTGALRVDAVAVQIGNGGGAATGELSLRLCQDGKCGEGTVPLTGSRDNDYLEIPLSPNLRLTFEAGAVSYSLQRISGTGEMVAWVYPGASNYASLQVNGDGTGEVLNLMLRQH